jgi:hypothetical protein
VVVTLGSHDSEANVGVRAGQTRYLQVTVTAARLLEQLTEVLSMPCSQRLETSSYTMKLLEHVKSLGTLLRVH